LKKDRWPEYHEHLQRALGEYLGDKIGTAPAGLTWETVETVLRRAALPEDVVSETRRLWEELDRVRFSPSSLNREDAVRLGTDVSVNLKRLEALWKE